MLDVVLNDFEVEQRSESILAKSDLVYTHSYVCEMSKETMYGFIIISNKISHIG